MALWDDNSFPLAYLITFRTYGTWLHGDERGSIDRYHNRFRGARVTANPGILRQHETKLKSEPVLLNSRQRPIVEASIREVCKFRQWRIQAVNIRTNHIHVVVSIGEIGPDKAVKDFKAYATRALKAAGHWQFDHSPWAEGSSKKYLWKESSVANACEYVVNGQGIDLPESF